MGAKNYVLILLSKIVLYIQGNLKDTKPTLAEDNTFLSKQKGLST